MGSVELSEKLVVVAVFPAKEAAEAALRDFHREGYDLNDVSLVGAHVREMEESAKAATASQNAERGGEIGAVAGGLVGIALGTALVFVPGVGPLLAAGSIAAAIAGLAEGAVAGAVLGGVAGALVDWGVPGASAHAYEARAAGGEVLVLYRGKPDDVAQAAELLRRHHPSAVDIHDERAAATGGI